jgi:2-polyprenyl-3-methyl-5-hydroxy-6-metoxy-1,4-benzoquinol methylase
MWADIAHIIYELLVVDDSRSHATPDMRLLDVGCALGFLVRNMRHRGVEAFGVDYSKYALNNAPKDVAEYLRWFDLTGRNDTFFGRNAFDIVTCFETLEHIKARSVRQAVQHLWNVTKPGGVLLATICTVGQPDISSDPTHVSVVPREWWERLLTDIGFVEEPVLADQLRWFWLFANHAGVFLYRKPV